MLVGEIFRLLVTTISNYEEEVNRQRKLLEDERSEFLINKAGLKKFFYIVLTLLVSLKTLKILKILKVSNLLNSQDTDTEKGTKVRG